MQRRKSTLRDVDIPYGYHSLSAKLRQKAGALEGAPGQKAVGPMP